MWAAETQTDGSLLRIIQKIYVTRSWFNHLQRNIRNSAFCTQHNLEKKKKKGWVWVGLIQNSPLFICYSLCTVVCWLQICTCPRGLSLLGFQPDFYEWCRHLNVPSASSLEDQRRGSLWSLSYCLLSFLPCVKYALSERVRALGGRGEEKHVHYCLGSKILANPLNPGDSKASGASLLFHVSGKRLGCHHWQRKCQSGCLHQ